MKSLKRALLAPIFAVALSVPALSYVNVQAAHATPPPPTGCGGLSQQELNVGILGNLYTQTLFADSAHSWYPAQNTSSSVTGGYANWNICWTTLGGGGSAPYYGKVCFDNLGSGASWLGNNVNEFNEQTATAGGCGPSEQYYFHCEDENLSNYQTGHFLMYNISTGDPVQVVGTYHGIGNVEVAEAGAGYDDFYNQGTVFCH